MESGHWEYTLIEPKVEVSKQTATSVPYVARSCAEGTINRVTSWIVTDSFLVQIFLQVLPNSSSQVESLEGLSALDGVASPNALACNDRWICTFSYLFSYFKVLYWALLRSRGNWSLGLWRLHSESLRRRGNEGLLLAIEKCKWSSLCIRPNGSSKQCSCDDSLVSLSESSVYLSRLKSSLIWIQYWEHRCCSRWYQLPPLHVNFLLQGSLGVKSAVASKEPSMGLWG